MQVSQFYKSVPITLDCISLLIYLIASRMISFREIRSVLVSRHIGINAARNNDDCTRNQIHYCRHAAQDPRNYLSVHWAGLNAMRE